MGLLSVKGVIHIEYGNGLTRQELVELLHNLVKIESTTGHEGEIAKFVIGFLTKLGLNPQVVKIDDERNPIYMKIPGKQPGSIAFVGHMDTVDVRGQNWIHDPFGADIEGSRMYGRGSSDMKSGLVTMIGTAAWLIRNNVIPEKSIIFGFTVEEEKGYKGARALANAGIFKDAELLIIPEPTEGLLCIGQKGQLWVDTTFNGRAAHAALPEMGANAAVAASDFAITVTEACHSFLEKPNLGHSTGSVDEVHGGWQINVIPNSAKVGVDFRVVDEHDYDKSLEIVSEASKKVCEKWGVMAESSIRQYVHPVVSDWKLPVVQKFINATSPKNDGSKGLKVVAYSTDGSVIVEKERMPLLVIGPGSIAKAHQPEEYLELDQLFDVLDIFIRFVSGEM